VSELSRFDQLMSVIIHASAQDYEFDRMGIVGDSVWRDQRRGFEWTVNKPGFKAYWERWGLDGEGEFEWRSKGSLMKRVKLERWWSEVKTSCVSK